MAHRLIVITGATGTGKTTVSRYLTQTYNIQRVMTHTTRPKRYNEVEGIDYAFETPASFDHNHYIEDVTYAGFRYGSSYESLYAAWDKHNFASIVLDTKGAITYAQKLGPAVKTLFLTIDDPAILESRLLERGDDPKMVAARLASPEYQRDLVLPAELKASATVIANDDWTQAQQQIDQFMKQLAKEVAGF
ncbi:guanylate kinase [Lacticaseibacillus porcinae]|uniref:guanylate kinase n=1 Tax=Lacticaseibacillus porcinae TaxID=1123687 RepID=UPI000F778ABB|nr:guanylate kinase [Lacticaseibacillus porcinae]